MKSSAATPPPPGGPSAPNAHSGRRPLRALFFFLLGVAVAVGWLEYGKSALGSRWAAAGGAGLSTDALGQLRHLNAPVELRFYSVLPTGSAPPSLQDFSGRVDRLLSQVAEANGSQIHVIRYAATFETNADAATDNGIEPFNLEKGEACFLGLAVVSGDRKESLARLQPEWEPALPCDLARAILRVAGEPAQPVVAAQNIPVPPAVTNEVARLIPDVKATSTEDAERVFHDDFLKQCAAVGAEMEAQVGAAQQELIQAQAGGSAAEIQAAQKKLADVQIAQAEKLKAVAAHLQQQLAVFQQLKAGAMK